MTVRCFTCITQGHGEGVSSEKDSAVQGSSAGILQQFCSCRNGVAEVVVQYYSRDHIQALLEAMHCCPYTTDWVNCR